MDYLRAFLALFAAIDVVAALPVYYALTNALASDERSRVLRQSCLTAFFVSTGFALLGKVVLHFLGIEVYDFKVAGGLLLVILSINDLITGERKVGTHSSTIGVVPIAMPLLVGPAVLTTILILLDSAGYPATLVGLFINLLLVWVTLGASQRILGLIGEPGAKAAGKVASLLLASLGVMMARRGVLEMIAAARAAGR